MGCSPYGDIYAWAERGTVAYMYRMGYDVELLGQKCSDDARLLPFAGFDKRLETSWSFRRL